MPTGGRTLHVTTKRPQSRAQGAGAPNSGEAPPPAARFVHLLFAAAGVAGGTNTFVAPLDRSTAPLASVLLPVYADEDAFAEAVAQFRQAVGEQNVTLDSVVTRLYADSFFSTHHPPNPDVQTPSVVVYPQNTEQVSRVLQIAHHHRVPVVASAGLTSLEGHNMHTRGPRSVALALGGLDEVVQLNAADLDVTVQAGVGWQELDEYLRLSEAGRHLMFGPDPGMGATIAGMVGTSASGTNAYRYGTMKENVVNLTVVLADGTVVKTRRRPRKSLAGYDLTRLFIGSEGTLGIVTEITVKLHPRPAHELVGIAAFPSIKDAAATAQTILSRLGLQPNAIELVNETTMSFVNESGVLDKKFLETPSLLLKVGGYNDRAIRELLHLIEQIARENHVILFEKSASPEDNDVLWGARRAGLWLTFDYGAKVLEDKNDVQLWTTDFAVPISKMAQLIDETNADLIALGFQNRFSVLGHVGDGNCHFLLLYNSKDYHKTKAVVDRMVERAIHYEGTCTGEHGVGVGKRAYVEAELGTPAVDLMRRLKFALDPRAILNPDKVFKIDPHENLDELLNSGHVLENPKCC
ncbi:FAD-binding domain-containing protein [Metschnikowia bicuspidata var. bicuspidata NRRL YB-4993]|uniref:D-lactate dehydrogenase (cytochrome) n=1 Tax=Metschnikowia bicuspidata var. bicuspidata NRRL YB-4993 TaxID=869754 RepID=A0A1A0HEN0_9ASCO|nr:FAD-binding domain-containing protein [Metschnikowia bicuspidata var. bicuspidata NRRL YB-4993]OBA22347.1 FAD-binding domain-containing protein [Metschnikowia bicuspidata var. bicuspidata NRRL YB-4993]